MRSEHDFSLNEGLAPKSVGAHPQLLFEQLAKVGQRSQLKRFTVMLLNA
ncbi:MAG: hypothetical protein K0Q59_1440 [Paenibacillus sp.]|nr:hypothetical protein [Paenibacillus sp.]